MSQRRRRPRRDISINSVLRLYCIYNNNYYYSPSSDDISKSENFLFTLYTIQNIVIDLRQIAENKLQYRFQYAAAVPIIVVTKLLSHYIMSDTAVLCFNDNIIIIVIIIRRPSNDYVLLKCNNNNIISDNTTTTYNSYWFIGYNMLYIYYNISIEKK